MYIGLREFRSVRGLKALGLQSRAFGRVGPKLLCRVRGFGLRAARARDSRVPGCRTVCLNPGHGSGLRVPFGSLQGLYTGTIGL